MEPRPEATVQVENNHVLVTRWCFAPGAETGWHRHAHNYVVVPQTSGELLLETQEGHSRASLKAGESYYRDLGVEHNVVNANDHEFVFIEIEWKG